MSNKLPQSLTPKNISKAIESFETKSTPHDFIDSTKFDCLHEGRRYPPKAIVALATLKQTGVLPSPSDFSAGAGSKCFRLLRDAGFRVVPKPGVVPFKVGSKYKRKDVGENLGTNDNMTSGNWATGYHLHTDVEAGIDGWFFLFAAVDDSGRTGHDYSNRWIENGRFEWQGKNGSKVTQPLIKKLLSGQYPVLLFTRTDSRDAFEYQGEVQAESHQATIPVTVVWNVASGSPKAPSKPDEIVTNEDEDFTGDSRRGEVNQRVGHDRFAKAVLDNFENKCCVTGISERELLVASHIVPWSENEESRLDPANGMCLSALFDKLFDRGFISFSDELEILVKSGPHSTGLEGILREVEGMKVTSPIKKQIGQKYLKWHRERHGF